MSTTSIQFHKRQMPSGGSPARCKRNAAFTLMEVILAMAVFALLSSAVFGVIHASLQATDDLQTSEREHRQVAGIIEICRKTFATLPPQAVIRSDLTQNVAPSLQELVFRNAPLTFAWDGSGLNYGTTTLGIRPQEDGRYSIAISRSDFFAADDGNAPASNASVTTVEDTSLEPDEQGRYWLVLVPDLEWATWRFYDSQINDWVESWTRQTRPRLIELQMMLSGDTIPVRAVFRVSTAQANVNG